MPNLNESLFENPEITDYFILDSNGEKYGQKDKDYSTYCYNIHRNKRLSKNSIFLYRKPQKLTSDSKFVIYGGGMISSITKPDENGDVTAHIKNGFVLPNPIHQDDITQDDIKKINKKDENKHNNKNKKSIPKTSTSKNWKHFWNQYGINKVNGESLKNLVGKQKFRPVNSGSQNSILDKDITSSKFELTLDNGITKTRKKANKVTVGKNIDFTKIQKNKNYYGKLGELLVLDLLIDKAKKNKSKLPEQVSKTKGDGLGYDIRAFDKNNCELQIEVKSTKGPYSDGFYMTKNECDIAAKNLKTYKIYRVFDINVEKATAKFRIFDGPFNDQHYDFETETVKVYLKD